MKIRFLLHNVHGPGGGVLTVTLSLAEELAKRHDVELVSAFASEEPPIHRLPAGVPVTDLLPPVDQIGNGGGRGREAWDVTGPSRLVPRGEPRFEHYSARSDQVLTEYLRSLGDGVLVTMQPGLTIAAARVGGGGCLRVAQDHRPFGSRSRALTKAYREHAEGLDAFLTLTKADARAFRRFLGDRVPVRAVRNGTPPYDGPLADQTSRTVVAAGRLSRSKGFDVLVDAWVHVAREHPEWRLEIWGDGDLREDLERQVHDRRLDGLVLLKGFSTQLQQELARAAAFVLSSRLEGYPRVLTEAMVCGLPVISTDCRSGPREMVAHDIEGLLVPNEDAVALGAAINDLIERGPQARRLLGEAARTRALQLSQPVVARKWERLFSDLAAGRLTSRSRPGGTRPGPRP